MMYEAGRESVKDRPSSLLWVVCYYYNGGESQRTPKIEVGSGPKKSDFMDEETQVFDGKGFLQALRQHVVEQPASEETGLHVRHVHTKLMRFLRLRISEAQVVDAMHITPNGRPWTKQAAWKVELWSRYWAGSSDERERMSRR